MKLHPTLSRLIVRLTNWLAKVEHNRATERAAMEYENWSRYATREGHEFFAKYFAEKAAKERKKKIL